MDFDSARLSDIRSHLDNGGPHVGDVTWWALTDARVARDELLRVWRDAGLSPDYLPEAPTPEKALKTALRDAAVGQTDRLIRLGKETELELIYAIVREQKNDDGTVSFEHETRILLDRALGGLVIDDPSHELAAGIRNGYETMRSTHLPDDLRRAMLKVLDASAAVTLREHGGVYWVPNVYADTLRKLQAAVERIGTSRVHILPIHATPEASTTLGEVAKSSIESDLEELRSEIEGFLSVPPERVGTLQRRLEAFEAIRAKAHLYRDVLRIQVDDLDTRIDQLTTTVEGLLAGEAVRSAA